MKKSKRILLLGDVNSIHIHKWIIALKDEFEVGIFSIDKLHQSNVWLRDLANVQIFDNLVNVSNSGNFLSYFKELPRLVKVYRSFKPAITHAHYATSYGFLGALLRPKNYFISVWGTDAYFFPGRSYFHNSLFKFIISSAKHVFATSKDLSKEVAKYTSSEISIIPFGIDTNKFRAALHKKDNDVFTIGTVKGLDLIYGIDRLINAFSIFHNKYPNSKCIIYGRGPHENQFREQIRGLGLEKSILLEGFIPNDEVPNVLRSLDVYCALSRSESFGVAVIEASACEVPVIVSNIGGLVEVVVDNETGFVVDGDDVEAIVLKMEKYYLQNDLRTKFGKEGRQFVVSHFDWEACVQQQKQFYNQYCTL